MRILLLVVFVLALNGCCCLRAPMVEGTPAEVGIEVEADGE